MNIIKNKNPFIAEYFKKTNKITKKYFENSIVTMQFFQRKNNSILCGMNEVIKLLKENTDVEKYQIWALKDGDKISAFESVLILKGPYYYFGHLEGLIDGILARNTSLASNAFQIKQVAKNIPIITMTDRGDHYSMIESDGYALSVGGLSNFVTDAASKWNNSKALGTMPHALIAMFEGNTLEAAKCFHKTFPSSDLIVLVDFNNDIINETLKIANYFKEDLKMVRVDTAPNMSDKYFKNNEEYGVTPNLIKALRNALDQSGYRWIKIIVSSGFNIDKINEFQKQKTPVDYFGVGKSLLTINNEFTGDIVLVNGKNIAKKGRKYKENKRLKLIK